MIKIKNRCAFTLVELLIVMTILTLTATLSIPILLRARHNANEAAAVASLRVIYGACTGFYSTQTPPTYPADLATLGSVTPPYIDPNLAGATSAEALKQGYFYSYALVNTNQFTCIATPAISGRTGTRIFFVDETGAIRLNDAAGSPVE